MRDIDLALSQVAQIRAQLVATTRFLGISPEFNVLMALLALGVVVIQTLYPQMQSALGYVSVWGAVIVASSAAVIVDAVSRARRLHGTMANTMLKAALFRILPFYLTGIFVTWVICLYAPESLWILPGLWLMLIGLTGFSSLSNLPRQIAWVAAWYLLSGAAVFLMSVQSQSLSPWLMGVPFIVGYLFVAGVLHRENCEGHHGRG